MPKAKKRKVKKKVSVKKEADPNKESLVEIVAKPVEGPVKPRKKILLIILLVALVFIFISVWGYIKINSLIGDGIIISSEPFYSSINLSYGDEAELSVELTLDNNILCSSTCTDYWISGDDVIKEDFSFRDKKEYVSTKSIQILDNGYGKRIYQHVVECHNVDSNICPSNGDVYRRTSTFMVNYGPSEEQLEVIGDALNEYVSLSTDIALLKARLDDLLGLVSNDDVDWGLNLIDDVRSVGSLGELKSDIVQTWSANEYDSALQMIRSAEVVVSSAKESFDAKENKTLEVLWNYNDAVSLANSLSDAGKLATYPGSGGSLDLIYDLINKTNSAIGIINGKGDYLLAKTLLKAAENDYQFSVLNYETAAKAAMKDYLEMYLACTNCSADDYVKKSLASVNQGNMIGLVEEQCSEVPPNTSDGSQALINKVTDWKVAGGTGTTYYDGNQGSNLTEYINERLQSISQRCRPEGTISALMFSEISYIQSSIVSLPDVLPQASLQPRQHDYPVILLHGHSFNVKNSAFQSTEVFNDLEDLFVDDGYIALGTPDKFDYSVQYEDLDVNAVFKPSYYITSYEDAFGIWSVQSKTQGIDSYALRLKEIIDYVKHLTGKDKVKVVAHSMGGLVVRRYVQIYGPNDIDSLIMVATPNDGIDEKTYVYCKLFGEERECDDMLRGSAFLGKLNDLNNVPVMPPTSIIAGKCIGEDNDGVVSFDSALLDDFPVLAVEGECSLGNLLHNNVLKMDTVDQSIINSVAQENKVLLT